MRLARLGAAHQTRLSFMRVLLRRLRRENWRFDRPVWEIDRRGVGRAVYRARGPRRTYSLVAFAHELDDAMRSDRVIATSWDATFTLFDGEPSAADVERLAENVPKQEAGRVSDAELSLSRANRSVRLWDHVVDRLAAGEQPDPAEIEAVGYLMRTTAVYGSGKFGAADRAAMAGRPLMEGPFRLEMLSVWLTRAFTLDLAEHVARARGGVAAAVIEPGLRRRLGVGNSTGLGMAPFLVNHPLLLNAWITARETAVARVRALPEDSPAAREGFVDMLSRAHLNAAGWRSTHPLQEEKCQRLRADLARVSERVDEGVLDERHPWDSLLRWGEATLSLEGQEQLAALILEPHGAMVDDLAEAMGADEEAAFCIDGPQPIGALRAGLVRDYGWALDADYEEPQHCARFWYVSAEKLEPRLGERHDEPGAEYEQPVDTGRAAQALMAALEGWADDATVAAFLDAEPAFRHTVRRAQIAAGRPYAEIRENLIGAEMLPVDMLRCKLAFFGATRFDPRSDRWVRICMYQGAPFPHELHDLPEDDWAYPRACEGMPVP
ncbi:MAG: hypothetical protein AAFP17_02530 [Pseudomonadota bacterium]